MFSESDSDLSDVDNQSSDSTDERLSNRRQLNIILFGDSGTGKSALINQIYDETVVESSNQAVGCTVENAKVSGTLRDYPNLSFNLYDTAGLSESDDGSMPTAQAFVQLIKLSYAIPDGIHLLICCHSKGRLSTEQFKANYRIFKKELCDDRIPCLLAITHCDTDNPINVWWDENQERARSQLKFSFIDGVCVSTLKASRNNPDQVRQQYTDSRRNLIEAITKYALPAPLSIDSWRRKVIVYARSFYNAVAKWVEWLGFIQASLRPDLEHMFIDLKYSPEDAKKETEKLLRELDGNDKDLIGPFQLINV